LLTAAEPKPKPKRGIGFAAHQAKYPELAGAAVETTTPTLMGGQDHFSKMEFYKTSGYVTADLIRRCPL
jgi:hypothetical protein